MSDFDDLGIDPGGESVLDDELAQETFKELYGRPSATKIVTLSRAAEDPALFTHGLEESIKYLALARRCKMFGRKFPDFRDFLGETDLLLAQLAQYWGLIVTSFAH